MYKLLVLSILSIKPKWVTTQKKAIELQYFYTDSVIRFFPTILECVKHVKLCLKINEKRTSSSV